ncbi:MAG: hypothetical protein GY705_30770 [Bacteroidetes bacterium]|nr:hypothetical protein [Bacteroidota bacterium]
MECLDKKHAVSGLIFSFFIVGLLILGCGPMQYYLKVAPIEEEEMPFVKSPVAPVQPDPVLTSLESVVDTDPIINSFKKGASIKYESTVGVMDFKATGGTGSGTLVADTFSISFLNRNVGVVERQNIKKITEEQMMAAKGMQSMNDSEIAKRIGRLTRADYIVFGAVTQYHFENRKLPIPYIIPANELRTYLADMKTYKNTRQNSQMQHAKNDETFFKYIKDDLLSQLMRYDTTSLNNLEIVKAVNWKNKSAQQLQWNYPYFKSRKVFPVIGEKKKDLMYQQQKIQQEISAWADSFKNFLKKRDESISPKEIKAFFRSSDKYNRSVLKRRKEEKEGKKKPEKMTKIFDDENIQRNKQFCSNASEKLKEYFDLLKKARSYGLNPIPEKHGQFELPPDKDSFVSVANLGITFKVIDVKTGEIVWIGQASKRDLNIQKGLSVMVEAVVKDIVGR